MLKVHKNIIILDLTTWGLDIFNDPNVLHLGEYIRRNSPLGHEVLNEGE